MSMTTIYTPLFIKTWFKTNNDTEFIHIVDDTRAISIVPIQLNKDNYLYLVIIKVCTDSIEFIKTINNYGLGIDQVIIEFNQSINDISNETYS